MYLVIGLRNGQLLLTVLPIVFQGLVCLSSLTWGFRLYLWGWIVRLRLMILNWRTKWSWFLQKTHCQGLQDSCVFFMTTISWLVGWRSFFAGRFARVPPELVFYSTWLCRPFPGFLDCARWSFCTVVQVWVAGVCCCSSDVRPQYGVRGLLFHSWHFGIPLKLFAPAFMILLWSCAGNLRHFNAFIIVKNTYDNTSRHMQIS